ncbi:MAG: hypothetical protein WCB19_08105 [Thermoplasmata archaeon]
MKERVHPLRIDLDVEPSEQPPRRPIGEATRDEVSLRALFVEQLREDPTLALRIESKFEEGPWAELRAAACRTPIFRDGGKGGAARAHGCGSSGPRSHSMNVS